MPNVYPTVSNAQRKVGWDFKLAEQARVKDFMVAFTGVYRDKGATPNATLIRVKLAAGEMTRTVSMLKDLVGAGRYGSQGQLGYEETQRTAERKVFADELSHGVPWEKFGYEAFERSPYSFIPMINKQLALWHMKMAGKRQRQALCEGHDEYTTGTYAQCGLTAADKYPHSNIYVVGAEPEGQAAYSATIGTYATAVNTIWEASAADPTDLSFLDKISEWAEGSTIQGLEQADGETMYLLSLPPRIVTLVYKLLAATDQYTSGEKARLGKLGRVYRNLIVVQDNKAPRLTLSDSALDFTYFGVTDQRGATGATKADVGLLQGKEAIMEAIMEELHYETEEQNYGKDNAIAAFCTKGFNRVDWDEAAGVNADTRLNYSSALILFKSAA